jgi:regulator of replication initiation timing
VTKDGEPKPASGGSWFPSAKKLARFVLDVFELRANVESLREQNKKLQVELHILQRQVDEQAGQISIMRSLITTTVHQMAERAGENAAQRLIYKIQDGRQD